MLSLFTTKIPVNGFSALHGGNIIQYLTKVLKICAVRGCYFPYTLHMVRKFLTFKFDHKLSKENSENKGFACFAGDTQHHEESFIYGLNYTVNSKEGNAL